MASFPLDKRCKEILQSIIYASGFIKVQTIADQMGVSKRSIYYDLNKINDWLRCNSMPEMKQQRAKGIFIEETYKKKIQEILFGQKEPGSIKITHQKSGKDWKCALPFCAIKISILKITWTSAM